MSIEIGLILMCAIISFGSMALVGFALWIRSRDENADKPPPGKKRYSLADLIAQCDLKSSPPKDMEV